MVAKRFYRGLVMDRFANTGLISLIHRVVSRSDPGLLADLPRPDPMQQAVSSEVAKRDIVGRVMDRYGPGMLLSVGQYLDLADETPTMTVMKDSPGPAVLADKWTRLERYHHASHRTAINTGEDWAWHCRRSSESTPATLGENCLIAGLLAGLLRAIGAEDVRLWIAGQAVGGEDLRDAALPPGERLESFKITWETDRMGQQPGVAGIDADRPVNDRLADLLAQDIGRSWKLRDAARGLAFSERSLQRHLSGEGRSFSSVLRRARMRAATALLTQGTTPLAEIGYCCGYADQAHFQRDFLRATNMTPRVFREVAASAP